MKNDNFKTVVKYAIFVFIAAVCSLLVIAAFVVGLSSVSPSTADGEPVHEDSIHMVGYSGDIDIYEDSKTGVQYLIYKDHSNLISYSGMCPRYNADGSLYQRQED